MATNSVILCTRNRWTDLVLCLESLAVQTIAPNEIIVIDSSDQPLITREDFCVIFSKERFGTTTCIYQHTKPGLTYQRNKGIDHATGDIIFFFDDDVILQKDYLAQMIEAFDSHSSYAAGMGDISNVIQSSLKYRLFRQFFLLPRQHASGNFTWSGMPTHPYGTNTFKSVEVLGGCCMAFRREVLINRRFDETFSGYAYLEDADIARRISYSYPIFFNPEAKLIHNESPAARDKIELNSSMFVYNYSYLFFKNWYPYNRLKIIGYWWSMLGLFLQAIIIRNRDQLRGYWRGLFRFWIR